jgi:hypothetical protein
MEGAGAAVGEAYAWAIENPGKVSCIYGENPLLHSNLAKTSPLDNLAPLARAGVPILHVCGSLDPWLNGQTRLAEKRYKELGGRSRSLCKKARGIIHSRPETRTWSSISSPVASGLRVNRHDSVEGERTRLACSVPRPRGTRVGLSHSQPLGTLFCRRLTGEGACSPRDEPNRSGLGVVSKDKPGRPEHGPRALWPRERQARRAGLFSRRQHPLGTSVEPASAQLVRPRPCCSRQAARPNNRCTHPGKRAGFHSSERRKCVATLRRSGSAPRRQRRMPG